AEYRGACFMGDWSLGVIYAVHFERQGASYKAKVERFCQGAPMNVTDVVVGPDGALYFVMGGRNSQGGVYRIAYKKREPTPAKVPVPTNTGLMMAQRQPLAAWSRDKLSGDWEAEQKAAIAKDLTSIVNDERAEWTPSRIKALTLMQMSNLAPDVKLL